MKSSSTGIKTCDADLPKINQVFKWILAGATEPDILEAVETSWPGTKPAPLIVVAVARIAASAHFDPHILRGFCFEASKDLYRRMVEIGDFTGALRAIRQLSEMAK